MALVCCLVTRQGTDLQVFLQVFSEVATYSYGCQAHLSLCSQLAPSEQNTLLVLAWWMGGFASGWSHTLGVKQRLNAKKYYGKFIIRKPGVATMAPPCVILIYIRKGVLYMRRVGLYMHRAVLYITGPYFTCTGLHYRCTWLYYRGPDSTVIPKSGFLKP